MLVGELRSHLLHNKKKKKKKKKNKLQGNFRYIRHSFKKKPSELLISMKLSLQHLTHITDFYSKRMRWLLWCPPSTETGTQRCFLNLHKIKQLHLVITNSKLATSGSKIYILIHYLYRGFPGGSGVKN